MDLKALLLEARQKVPPVLQVLHCGDESMLDIGGDCGAGSLSPPAGGWQEGVLEFRNTKQGPRVPNRVPEVQGVDPGP